jgi:DNA N-6-adenine-methyltransferase (Dam)
MTLPLFDRDGDSWGDRDSWCTPPAIIDRLLQLWPEGIDLDPCSNVHSIVPARLRFDASADGLDVEWDSHSTVYVNPPYSDSSVWMRKFAALRAAEAVGCVLCDPSVSWWRHVWSCDAVCFPYRRMQFLAPPGVAASSFNRPVALPYRGRRPGAFAEAFGSLGKVVTL